MERSCSPIAYGQEIRRAPSSCGRANLHAHLQRIDQVAIKKLANITENHHLLIQASAPPGAAPHMPLPWHAHAPINRCAAAMMQSLRELKLMRLLNHESIISARSVPPAHCLLAHASGIQVAAAVEPVAQLGLMDDRRQS